ncbi:MAG: hypothetical protein HY908_25265 [Myxococcales bacterium]|nr:hypothetical protein [Myxococcales bacterium]
MTLRSSRLTCLLPSVALAALAGCSTHLDANDYDRSCTTAMECTVVFVGDVCDCKCDLSAINVADYQHYLDDRGSPNCSKDCGPCQAYAPACINHVCEAVPK